MLVRTLRIGKMLHSAMNSILESPGIGPQVTKRIKRRRGSAWRYRPENVHRKKLTSKDTKAKAREEEPLKLLNVFAVIGFNYRKIIPYKVDNLEFHQISAFWSLWRIHSGRNSILNVVLHRKLVRDGLLGFLRRNRPAYDSTNVQ